MLFPEVRLATDTTSFVQAVRATAVSGAVGRTARRPAPCHRLFKNGPGHNRPPVQLRTNRLILSADALVMSTALFTMYCCAAVLLLCCCTAVVLLHCCCAAVLLWCCVTVWAAAVLRELADTAYCTPYTQLLSCTALCCQSQLQLGVTAKKKK